MKKNRLKLELKPALTMTQDGREVLIEMDRAARAAFRENDSDAIEWALLTIGRLSRAFEERHAQEIAIIRGEESIEIIPLRPSSSASSLAHGAS